MSKEVILVDENDNEIGVAEKIKAHREGALHRAFSIFIVNNKDELLIQKRSAIKYHSPSLWSNTCCSHPQKNEILEEAAHKRLMEEMGFDCPLKKLFSFQYKVEFDNGLIEHEIDHVFLGIYNHDPHPNEAEVSDWKWENMDVLKKKIDEHPQDYTFWLKHVYIRFYHAYHNFPLKI